LTVYGCFADQQQESYKHRKGDQSATHTPNHVWLITLLLPTTNSLTTSRLEEIQNWTGWPKCTTRA
jgi:hypothetical protein